MFAGGLITNRTGFRDMAGAGKQSRRTTIENDRGLTLKGIVEYPKKVRAGKEYPAVILSHSFTGFKEIKHLAHLSNQLVENGFFTFRFDFADCVGESEGTCEEMTLTHQVDDLLTILNHVASKDPVDPDRIGLMGHSLGGLTSIVAASRDDRPAALVPVSSAANTGGENLFGENEVERWKQEGHIHFHTYKRGEVKINYSFYEDLQQYDGAETIRDVHCPVRFIHGTHDNIVPHENSQKMHDAANDPKDLQLIDGADHLFRDKEDEKQMLDAAVDWFEEWMGEE